MTRRLFVITTAILLTIFLISGCGMAPRGTQDSAPSEEPAYDKDVGEAPEEERSGEEARPEESGEVDTIDGGGDGIANANGQKQIKNGEITIEVASPEETMSEVVDLVDSMGGYVSDSNLQQFRDDDRPRINMTVRIPQEEFDTLSREMYELGVVTQSRTWVNDVTEEYIDLNARLENLRSEEEALRGILEKAEEVEDMLEVRRQLNDVRSQIDSLSGRLRYLDDRIAHSTYRINIHPESVATSAIKATGFDNFGSQLVTSFIRGANWVINGVATATIALATALPSLIILAVVLGLLWAAYRRWGTNLF
ncbi:MAG: DUF4349 domain-containing protein [Clostridia bacterium]